MGTRQSLEAMAERLEQADGLDGVAAKVQGLLRKAVPQGPVEDLLRGRPIGHPVHPALVAVPIGAWTSALVLDLVHGDAGAARKLTALGCVSAIPTAAAGATDWLSTHGAPRRVGLVHGLVNDAALMLFLLSWRARRRGSRGSGFVLSMLGGGLLGAGGWLGGHLAYSQGVGVDTTDYRRRQAGAERSRHTDTPAAAGTPSG
jgi:uncharacterized membrane protein